MSARSDSQRSSDTRARPIRLSGNRRLLDEYARWIGQEPHDLFVTLTHDQRRAHGVRRKASPEGMDKRFRLCLRLMAIALYGKHPERRKLILSAVYGIERTKAWDPHVHALVRLPIMPPHLDTELLQRICTETGGFSKVEQPRCQSDTTDYVCKYVVKEGELFFTPTWESKVCTTTLF
jgi:hypothetical protein